MNNVQFVNLTPHDVNIQNLDGTMMVIPPDGTVARLPMHSEVKQILNGVEFRKSTKGTANVPDPVSGVIWIVSAMVRESFPDRKDMVSPGELIRDAKGNPVGCKWFEMN